MLAHVPIQELLRKLKHGDQAALREFVAQYEPYIRRAIRPRLARAKLRAVADSADVCQSVLGSFLIHLTSQEYEIRSAQDLEKLLFGMARKKFAMLARREYADRRDRSRVRSLLSDHDRPGGAGDDPGEIEGARDLLDHVRRQLPEDERALYALRLDGKSWDEIADRVGGSAVKLRKRLSRALHRVAVELGLEEDDDGPAG